MSSARAFFVAAALVGAAVPAQAQYYSPQAALSPARSYAIEVAPGTYVIHRTDTRNYPYVGGARDDRAPASRERRTHARVRTHNDPALIAELRRKHARKHERAIRTTRIVREKPIVIEHRRIVDDPPRVIERVRYSDGKPAKRAAPVTVDASAGTRQGERRIIRADAEVTILGPDRMSIRLLRKREARGTSND